MTSWGKRPWIAIVLVCLLPCGALAQTDPPAASSSATTTSQLLKPAELDGLVAPIALYPDSLLANVLMASTYPLEVVQADRWVGDNKQLKEDQLKAEADKQPWDESVKSLVATPSVLTTMSTKLDWTQKLGDAVLAQQPDVMDAIQRLRSKAYANNKLSSGEQQTVTVKQEAGRQVIDIEPAVANTVYVPYYDPATVYGEWPYSDYPPYPYYWPAPGYIAAGVIATGIAFGAAYGIARWANGGRYWGGSINWSGGGINVNRGARVEHWQHNPAHRQGVRYNNSAVQQRFGNQNIRPGNNADFRGRNGDQVLRPGAGDRGAGNRGANVSDRMDRGAGNRGDHNKAGNRAGTSDRRANAGRPNGGRDVARNRSGHAAHASRGNSHRAQVSRASHVSHASAGRGGSRAAGAAHRGGGHGGGGGRGGGRRSDIRLKHDVVLLGYLDNGLGFYRFAYSGSAKAYVGVIAQEVQRILPDAVTVGRDGYLRVFYDKLGLIFQTYQQWLASGRRIPATSTIPTTGVTIQADERNQQILRGDVP